MKTEFYVGDPTSMVWVPEGHQEAAERVLALMPDEWDQVIAHPAYEKADIPDEPDSVMDVGYLGMGFWFIKGDYEVAIAVEDPQSLLDDPGLLESYLGKVRASFSARKNGEP